MFFLIFQEELVFEIPLDHQIVDTNNTEIIQLTAINQIPEEDVNRVHVLM